MRRASAIASNYSGGGRDDARHSLFEDAEVLVGAAVGAGGQSGGEQAAGFIPVDGSSPLARGVAVPGVKLGGGPSGSDAEFDDPVGDRRAASAAAFLLGFLLPHGGDLVVDPLQPHDMPDPERKKTLQVRRQIIEHSASRSCRAQGRTPRVFEF